MTAMDLNVTLQQGSLAIKGAGNVHSTRYDFPFANFIYEQGFFAELSRIQSAVVSGDPIEVNGKQWDLERPGDLLALQQYMSVLEGAKDAVDGLGKGGLKAQNDALSNIKGVI